MRAMKVSRFSLVLSFLVLTATHQSWADELPTKILFIGDSHSVMGFGDSLYKKLNAEYPDQVATYSSCGSTLRHWGVGKKKDIGTPTKCGYRERGRAGKVYISYNDIKSGKAKPPRTPLLTRLIPKHDAEIIVVQQGTNYIGRSKAVLQNDIHDLLKKIKGTSCVWIGPPNTRFSEEEGGMSLPEVNKVIRETLAEANPTCKFFNSYAVTEYPAGGDGKHFDGAKGGRALALAWGNEAADFVIKGVSQQTAATPAPDASNQPSGTDVR